jgi:hypothetical protein
MSLSPPYNITRDPEPFFDEILDVPALNFTINGIDFTAQEDLAEKLIYLLEGDNELPYQEKIEVQFVFNDWEDKYGTKHRRLHCFYTAAPYDDMETTSKPTHCIGWFYNPSEEKVETDTIPYRFMPTTEQLANATPVFSDPKERHAVANYDMEQFERMCQIIVDLTRAVMDEDHTKTLFIAHEAWPNQSGEIFIEKNDKGETGVYYNGKHIMELIGELERDLQSEFGHLQTNDLIGRLTMEDIQKNPLEPEDQAFVEGFTYDQEEDTEEAENIGFDDDSLLRFLTWTTTQDESYTFSLQNDLPPYSISNINKTPPNQTTPQPDTYLGEASPEKERVPVFRAQARVYTAITKALQMLRQAFQAFYQKTA